MKRTWLGLIFTAAVFIGEALCAAGAGSELVSLAGSGWDFDIAPVSAPSGISAAKSFPNGIMDGFALGINYPWLHCGWDFGATAWGHRGISDPESRAAAAADFARMRAKGAKVVRWFVMLDGRAAPEFDGLGMVTGFDNYFYADLDAALEISKANDIKLVLVLFNFNLVDDVKVSNGVRIGGHANLVKDPAARKSLFDNALLPLFKKYGSDPAILAWEVMNEPEMRMKSFPPFGPKKVEPSQMHSFVREVAALAHANTNQLVTLGSATSGELAQWKGKGLDFYQYHYYDYMAWLLIPFNVKYSGLELDKPCVLGEFGTASGKSLETYLDMAFNNGFAGAWAWSYRAGDDESDFNSVAGRFGVWANAHR